MQPAGVVAISLATLKGRGGRRRLASRRSAYLVGGIGDRGRMVGSGARQQVASEAT